MAFDHTICGEASKLFTSEIVGLHFGNCATAERLSVRQSVKMLPINAVESGFVHKSEMQTALRHKLGDRKFERLEADRTTLLRRMQSAAENRMYERQAKEKCTSKSQSQQSLSQSGGRPTTT